MATRGSVRGYSLSVRRLSDYDGAFKNKGSGMWKMTGGYAGEFRGAEGSNRNAVHQRRGQVGSPASACWSHLFQRSDLVQLLLRPCPVPVGEELPLMESRPLSY
jgi:hypothetical protein